MIRHRLTDRVLHRLALQSRGFRKFCFARECERNGRRFDHRREHVFIAGVARSGSTALLNELHASGSFAATRYALMPFVLAPSLARVTRGLSSAPQVPVERRHGDSLQVGPQSPEALDGVFWSTFLAAGDDPLRPLEVAQPLLENYARFIENILCHYDKARYLSKMNQGIALLPSLAPWFRQSLFLVPFRDPLQQATSLLRQHRRFSGLDGYESAYLEWLGHREFGDTHHAFTADLPRQSTNRSPEHLDYWLEQWRNGYRFLIRLVETEDNVIPLAYERLAASGAPWRWLSRRLDVELYGSSFTSRNDASLAPFDVDRALLDQCRDLYRQLLTLGEAATC